MRPRGRLSQLVENRDTPSRAADGLAQGERALALAVELAQGRWGRRLVASYAIGSLAHGSFSAHVSDIDVGFVLHDPLDDRDAESVKQIVAEARSRRVPLGDRLSIFWGSPSTLAGTATGGRFPPHDALDLKRSGRLLAGREVKSFVRAPTSQELILSTAAFALRTLVTDEVLSLVRNPVRLAGAGLKTLTKLVLYPARFLFTARTGNVGVNDGAVEHFRAMEGGAAGELLSRALEWRQQPPLANDPEPVKWLRKGMLPLYRVFLDDYLARLQQYREHDLVHAYQEWQQRLAA